MQFKINGVYDIDTLKNIQALGIRHVSFDMRPTSMNFLQLYKILDFMEQFNGLFNSFSLHYNNEKDFVIKRAIEDIEKKGLDTSFYLEFDDLQLRDFCDQFERRYVWNYHPNLDLTDMLSSNYLKVIKFDEAQMIKLEQQGDIFEVLKNVFELKNKFGFQVEISCRWNTQLSTSILDFFEFDLISFSINESVESAYRSVNHQLLEKNFSIIRKQYLKEGEL